MALLGLYLDRETFRSLWGVLGMLPAPRGITRAREPATGSPGRAANPAILTSTPAPTSTCTTRSSGSWN